MSLPLAYGPAETVFPKSRFLAKPPNFARLKFPIHNRDYRCFIEEKSLFTRTQFSKQSASKSRLNKNPIKTTLPNSSSNNPIASADGSFSCQTIKLTG